MADSFSGAWFLPLHHEPPIRVDFLRPEHLPAPGRLGLTIAPGTTHSPSEPVGPNLVERDVRRLVEEYRARALVTLQEDEEIRSLPGGDPRAEATFQGLESLWLPIVDGSAPRSVRDVAPTVERVVALVQAGETVVIHCLGGLGRSGLLAACVLVRLGATVKDAMARVRLDRPGAIQTRVQERYIARYAARLTTNEEEAR